MVTEILILILIAFMLIAALVAVETADLLSSVIALGAAGFALSVIDLLVGAPDLAITQVAVEVIALVLLIRVVLTRRDESVPARRDALRTGLVLLASGVFLAVSLFAVGALSKDGVMPPFGQPVLAGGAKVPPGVSADYLANAARQPEETGAGKGTGAPNAVMAVLLDYRAYDTLGEATVIFVAIIGTYAIIRRIGRRKGEQPQP